MCKVIGGSLFLPQVFKKKLLFTICKKQKSLKGKLSFVSKIKNPDEGTQLIRSVQANQFVSDEIWIPIIQKNYSSNVRNLVHKITF